MEILRLLLLILLLFSCTGQGPLNRAPASEEKIFNVEDPLTSPDDLTKTYEVNSVQRIETAKIVYADYELLRRDFPPLRELSNPDIDQWLLDNAAFMSSSQVEQSNANNEIKVTSEKRVAYRPEDYGRALVFPAESPSDLSEDEVLKKEILSQFQIFLNKERPDAKEKLTALKVQISKLQESDEVFFNQANNLLKVYEKYHNSSGALAPKKDKVKAQYLKLEKDNRTFIALLDAKGVGSLTPRAGDHSDGLMTLGEAIREFAYEKMVNRLFLHDGGEIKTVGSYAVIDGGYSVKHKDGSSSPAGILLRQPHARAPGHSSTFSETDSLKVEKVLRRYGLTSAGAYRDKYPFDKINVQGTPQGAVIDFGGFLAVKDFGGRKAQHFFGYTDLLDDSSSNSVAIVQDIRVPLEQWGSTLSGKEDPKLDNPWIWSHDLARAFSEGRASRDDAYNHLRNLWGPIYNKLENYGPPPKAMGCHDLLKEILNR